MWLMGWMSQKKGTPLSPLRRARLHHATVFPRCLWTRPPGPRYQDGHSVLKACFRLYRGLFRRCCRGRNCVSEAASLLTSLQHPASVGGKRGGGSDRLLPEQDLPNALLTGCFGGGQAV